MERAATPGPSRTVGARLWRTVGALLALAAVGWGAFNVVVLVAHEERTEVTRYDAAQVRVLDVVSSAGSVTIIGSPDRREIRVTADISDGMRKTGQRQAVVDGRLELRASCPVIGSEWCRVTYTVEVPTDLEVRARADDGRLRVSRIDGPVDLKGGNGPVEVSDVRGRVTIDDDNGRITATRLTSDAVVATTNNGSVTVELLAPPATVEARSTNGNVEVILPNTGDAYRLDISTNNGHTSNEIRTDPASDRHLVIESDNGDVTARYAA
jgi:hypothetical protein